MNCTDISHIRLGPRPETPEELEKRITRIVEQITNHLRTKEYTMLRCKMRVNEVLQVKEADGSISQERVKLSAVYSSDKDSENAKWSKWTPSANLDIYISNPEAFGKLSSGHEFFVDFTPAS